MESGKVFHLFDNLVSFFFGFFLSLDGARSSGLETPQRLHHAHLGETRAAGGISAASPACLGTFSRGAGEPTAGSPGAQNPDKIVETVPVSGSTFVMSEIVRKFHRSPVAQSVSARYL